MFSEICKGLLMGFFIGLAIFCFCKPARAGGYPPSTPIIALLRTTDGCPKGQLRAWVSFNPRETYKFCWRLQGDLVEVLDRDYLVTTMPARWFDKPEQAQ